MSTEAKPACLHCEIMDLMQARCEGGEQFGPKQMEKIVEVICDIVHGAPEDMRTLMATHVSSRLAATLMDVLKGLYKVNAQAFDARSTAGATTH